MEQMKPKLENALWLNHNVAQLDKSLNIKHKTNKIIKIYTEIIQR